jgi:hypothetical protein
MQVFERSDVFVSLYSSGGAMQGPICQNHRSVVQRKQAPDDASEQLVGLFASLLIMLLLFRNTSIRRD